MSNESIIEYFKSLSESQQKKVINDLLESLSRKESTVLSVRQSEIEKAGLVCPHCHGKKVVGYGKYKEVKRYRCKDCRKTFNSLTGTTVHWLHKRDLIKEYLYMMLMGYSLRKIASRMDICLKTAFDWIHKILSGLSTDENLKLKGVVEADETFFLQSEKGNKNIVGRKARKRGGKASSKGINKDHITVLTAYERKSGECVNTVVCKGRITKNAIEKGLSYLEKDKSILCVDSHKSFEGYAIDNGIDVKRIFVRRKAFVVEKIYHIQHVNNIHGNLKRWIQPFHGVSSKYLQNYLNYFNLVRKVASSVNKAEKALIEVLKSNNAFIKRDQINQQVCIT